MSPDLTTERSLESILTGSAPAGCTDTVLRGPELAFLPTATLVAISVDGHGDAAASSGEPSEADQLQMLEDFRIAAHHAGFEAGRAAAAQDEIQQIAPLLDALNAAAGNAACLADRHLSDSSAAAVELALQLTELLLQRELQLAQNPGRDALLRCVAELPGTAEAVVRLNPDDLARLDSFEDDLGGRSWRLVGDRSMASGDAEVDFEGGSLDARLAEAFARVAAVVRS